MLTMMLTMMDDELMTTCFKGKLMQGSRGVTNGLESSGKNLNLSHKSFIQGNRS